MHPQPGIFALGAVEHSYLELELLPGVDPAALVGALAALSGAETTWRDGLVATTELEAHMAHAVVMQVKLAEGGGSEEGLRMLTEQVVPHAKSQPGFQRGTWLNDGGNGMGIVMFDTAEQAAAAQAALKPPAGGPELVSSSVFVVAAEA